MATANIPMYIPLDMVDEFRALMESNYNLRITRDGWRMTPLRESPSLPSPPPVPLRRTSKSTASKTQGTEPIDDEHMAHQLASADQSPTSPRSSNAKCLDTGAFASGTPGIMGYLSTPLTQTKAQGTSKSTVETQGEVQETKETQGTSKSTVEAQGVEPKAKRRLNSYQLFCKETLALYSEEELARIETTSGPRQKWRICAEAWKTLKAECERGDWEAVQKMAALRKAAEMHNAEVKAQEQAQGTSKSTVKAQAQGKAQEQAQGTSISTVKAQAQEKAQEKAQGASSKSTARVAVKEQWSCQVCLMANPGSRTVCICCGRVKGTVPSPVLRRAHLLGRVQEGEGQSEGQGESKGQEWCESSVCVNGEPWVELEKQWLRDELGDDFDESPEGHEEVDKILAHKYLQAARSYIFLILFKGDPRPQWVNSDECECHESIVEYFETKRPWDGVSPYSQLDLYMQHRRPMTTAPFE